MERPDGATSEATTATAVSLRVGTATAEAVATLEALCAHRNECVRLKAASKLIDAAVEYSQEALVVERLAALEGRVAEVKAE